MTSEILCTIIATVGVVLSGLFSWFVARTSANREIKKLKLSWEREDLKSIEDEFSDMCGAVSYYLASQRYDDQSTALQMVSTVRSRESGDMAAKLDTLYVFLRKEDDKATERALTEVIEQKRKEKLQTKPKKKK